MSTNTPNIRPLHDRIVVKQKEVETKSAGGIYIPDTADSAKEKPMQGKIMAVGKGKYYDGKLQPLDVKVGDDILFGKYAGTPVKISGNEYLIMREEDVMGILE